MKFKTVLTFLFLFFPAILWSQSRPVIKKYNTTSFTERSHALKDGKTLEVLLPYGSPCKDCYEVLEDRTATHRYFEKPADKGGKKIYSQSSVGDINYFENGVWNEINYRLKPVNKNYFVADEQQNPVSIDMKTGEASISSLGHEIVFNKNLFLYWTNGKGKIKSLGEGNFSDYTVGDEGVHVRNWYQGIDLYYLVNEGKVKTNVVLTAPLHFKNGWLVLSQDILIPDGAHVVDAGHLIETSSLSGEYFVQTETDLLFTISENIAFDNESGEPLKLKAEFDGQQYLVYTPIQWLNNKDRKYPVTIDPMLSANNSVPQASITGSGYNAACYATGCAYNTVVATPAQVTVTDVYFSFDYNAINMCRMLDGGIKITYGACNSPAAGAYNCPIATNGVCSADSLSVFADVQGCIPPPQCASYNMNFTMTFYRCNFDNTAGCTANCIAANSAWIMTVEGHTVELASITANPQICEGQNTNVIVVPQYGVPPYSYLWSTGGTNDTINVAPASTTNYSVTITDACGNVANGMTTVNVIPNTNPGFTVANNPTCVGAPVVCTGLGSGAAASYNWMLPGSTSPIQGGTQIASTSYNLPGAYVMFLNYVVGTCTFTNTQNITVFSTLPAGVSINITPNGTLCAGALITFTAVPNNGGSAPAYQWLVNAVPIAGATNDSYNTSGINNGDVVSVQMVSNSPCANPANASAAVFMNITASVVPSVTIAANPAGAICAGTNVTFTANPVNGGGAPSYQWQLNGVNVGGNSSTYSNAALSNGDIVSVTMTSNAVCPVPSTAAAQVIMNVTPNVTPTVNIATNPGLNICTGTNVTFTANITNGGAAPSYQWQLNGFNVGGNSNTYTNATLNNGDIVSVTLTSNANCASPVTASTAVAMVVTASVVPSVTIAANPGLIICSGTNVTFTASPVNGGGAPSYQWQLNGVNVGANLATYSNAGLNNGDIVSVTLTSSVGCAVPATGSAQVVTTVNANVTPTVNITSNPGLNICAGTNVTFTANITNGGAAPSYQWQLNGVNVGVNSNSYTNASLSNGDIVSVTLTSNANCSSPSSVSSQVVMVVTSNVTPTVNIASNPGLIICAGTNVIFTANITNGGAAPNYQWQVNGVNAGGNNATFNSSALSDNDIVSVTLTSNANCASPVTANQQVVMDVQPIYNPTVNILTNPGTNICSGTAITFTADTLDGSATNSIQWLLNGVNVASGVTYTNATLNNGDVVSVQYISNALCSQPDTAIDSEAITVSSASPPVVTMNNNAGVVVCEGSSITFYANAVNGGSNPVFDWYLNGVHQLQQLDSLVVASVMSGDSLSVVLTSNAACSPVNSDTTYFVINATATVAPSVSLNVNPAGPQCAGTNIIVSSNVVNGGTNTTYQWYINQTLTGNIASTLGASNFNDNDTVICIVTSNANCASPQTDTSFVIIDILPSGSPSVFLVPITGYCLFDTVMFVAQPNNGGSNPSYTWNYSGTPVVNNNDTLFLPLTIPGGTVHVEMTSSDPCVSGIGQGNWFTSPIASQIADVTVTSSTTDTLCLGQNISFTAQPGTGLTNISYQWYVNGISQGINSATFSGNNLADGDLVEVVLTIPNGNCVLKAADTAIANVIHFYPALSVVASNGVSICRGESVLISSAASGGNGGPYNFSWSNGSSADEITVAPATTTTYNVSVSDNCTTTPAVTSVNVQILTTPDAGFSYSPLSVIISSPEVSFTNLTQGASIYMWDFGDGDTSHLQNPEHVYNQSGTYAVTLYAIASSGCADSVQYNIVVKEEFFIYVPNTFTPNNDGINETFAPIISGTDDYTWTIFDRWGGVIFLGDKNSVWAGQNQKSLLPVQDGVYVYKIDLPSEIQVDVKKLTGSIAIIR